MTGVRRQAAAFAVLACAWVLGLELLGIGAALAYLAPALLILLPLVGGRYPGDRALARVAGRRRATPAWRRSARAVMPRRRRPTLLPRGGRLVGAALAGRAPPLAA